MGTSDQKIFLAVAAVCFLFIVFLVVHLIRKKGGNIVWTRRRHPKGYPRKEDSAAPEGGSAKFAGGAVLCALCGIVFGSMVARSPFDRY
jgi:hypothetical protein